MEKQVTYEQLYAMKEEYPFHKIIYVEFQGMEFVLRSLNREEYNQIVSIVRDDKDLEDVITQAALIYPEDFEMASCPFAGIPQTLAGLVTEASDVTNIDTLIDLLKNSQVVAERFDYQCLTLIKAAMPEESFEEMQKWTWEKIMFYTALAQKILNYTLPADAKIDLIDRREEVKKEIEQPKTHTPEEEKEFVLELRKKGIDPMFYFNDTGTIRMNLIEDPLLGGRYWNDEGVLNEIKKTIRERRHRRDVARRKSLD